MEIPVEIYVLNNDLSFKLVSDNNQPLPINGLCFIHRIHHQRNVSRAGNSYDYYRYEFYDSNMQQCIVKYGNTKLIEITPEHWFLNGMHQYNFDCTIADSDGIEMEYHFGSSSHISLLQELFITIKEINSSCLINGSGYRGHRGYFLRKGCVRLLESALHKRIITIDIYNQLNNLYK